MKKTQFRSKLLSVMLVLVMVFALVPLSAFTAFAMLSPTVHPDSVWVGGVEMETNTYLANGATSTTDAAPAEGGYAHYDSDGVLTLNNYTYAGEGKTFDISLKSVIYVEATGYVTVNLVGENILTNTDNAEAYDPHGIYMKNGQLTITGDGSLSVNAINNGITVQSSALIMKSGTLSVNAKWGITANAFYMEGGTAEITTEQQAVKAGATGSVVITGGNLTVSNSGTQYPAINKAPYLEEYEGAYEITVSTNADGSSPVTYDEENYASYKYYKIEKGVDDYGIIIADPRKTDPDDPGVRITGANCTDVFGDGTVSYDPETKTLTLDNYVYDGLGALNLSYVGIMFVDDTSYTIELKGRNSIKVSGEMSAGIMSMSIYDLTFTGEGSLYVEASVYGIGAGAIWGEGGNITVATTEIPSMALFAGSGVGIRGGSVKLESAMFGIMINSDDPYLYLAGGSLEVAVTTAGRAIMHTVDGGIDRAVTFAPEFRPDAYISTASVKSNGSEAVAYNPDDLATYKYVKLEVDPSYVEYNIAISEPGNDDLWPQGVLITSKNYTDVLGNGTVSYDPETKTLTLNNYVYEGNGLSYNTGGIVFYGEDENDYTILLKGNNSIKLNNTDHGRGISYEGMREDVALTITGDGSLTIQTSAIGIVGASTLEIKSGNVSVKSACGFGADKFVMNGGSLAINAGRAIDGASFEMNGGSMDIEADYGIMMYEFFMMNGGSLKIDAWSAVYVDKGVAKITGGELEISITEAGCLFGYYDEEEDEELALAPDLSQYRGIYAVTASVNRNGSGAVTYNPADIASYKYLKIVHTHEFGTTWKTDANNHWKECECGEKSENAAHIDENDDNKCDICDYAMPAHDPDTPNNPDNTPDNPNNTPDDPSDDKDGLGTGAIVGIVVGSVAVVGIGGFALLWFVIKKKSFADLIAVFKK